MKIRQFKLSAISFIFGLAFDGAATFAGQVQELTRPKQSAPASAVIATNMKWRRGTRATFQDFDTMHRNAEAQKICAGQIKRIRSELGLPCHYTVQTKAGTSEPIAAVPCEIVPWRRSRLEQMADNHRKLSREERRIKAAPAGMILPDDTCAVTANRCQCRLVPNEKAGQHGRSYPRHLRSGVDQRRRAQVKQQGTARSGCGQRCRSLPVTVENRINHRKLSAASRWPGRQLVSFEDG